MNGQEAADGHSEQPWQQRRGSLSRRPQGAARVLLRSCSGREKTGCIGTSGKVAWSRKIGGAEARQRRICAVAQLAVAVCCAGSGRARPQPGQSAPGQVAAGLVAPRGCSRPGRGAARWVMRRRQRDA